MKIFGLLGCTSCNIRYKLWAPICIFLPLLNGKQKSLPSALPINLHSHNFVGGLNKTPRLMIWLELCEWHGCNNSSSFRNKAGRSTPSAPFCFLLVKIIMPLIAKVNQVCDHRIHKVHYNWNAYRLSDHSRQSSYDFAAFFSKGNCAFTIKSPFHIIPLEFTNIQTLSLEHLELEVTTSYSTMSLTLYI